MKAIAMRLLVLFVGAAASFSPAKGQETKAVSGPVSTGEVVSVNPDTGVLTLKSGQTHELMTFYGMDLAKVETSTGRAAKLAEVTPKTLVTVHYTTRQGRWYVQKLGIPEPAPTTPVPAPTAAPAPLTGSEEHAAASKAATDADITTNPGVKARLDNDITTQPGKKDPADPDITKKADN